MFLSIFTANPGGAYTNKSLLQVLWTTGGDDNFPLARHVVAAFLSAVAFGDEAAMLSVSQCKAIWNGQGVWSPYAGANWTFDNTMTYFEKVYGPAFIIRS